MHRAEGIQAIGKCKATSALATGHKQDNSSAGGQDATPVIARSTVVSCDEAISALDSDPTTKPATPISCWYTIIRLNSTPKEEP